jgi:hypothetical protein
VDNFGCNPFSFVKIKIIKIKRKYKLEQWPKRFTSSQLLTILIVVVLLVLAIIIGKLEKRPPKLLLPQAQAAVIENEDPYQPWLADLLLRLKTAESSNDPLAVNHQDKKKTGESSIGCYQYQPKTFIAKVREYNLLPEVEDKELMNWIWDCRFQEEVTGLILKEPEGWRHWYTSFKRLKLPVYQAKVGS